MSSFWVSSNNAKQTVLQMLSCSWNSIAERGKRETVTTFRISSASASNSTVIYGYSGVLYWNFIQFTTFRKCGQFWRSTAELTPNVQLLSPASSYNVGLEFQPWPNEILPSTVVPYCVFVWHFIPEVLVSVHGFLIYCVNRCIQYCCFPSKEHVLKRNRFCPSALKRIILLSPLDTAASATSGELRHSQIETNTPVSYLDAILSPCCHT